MQRDEFKAHAYKNVCNAYGIEIMINVSGDGVAWRYTDETEIHEAEILYDSEGEPYFLIREGDNEDNREYLSDYMRTS